METKLVKADLNSILNRPTAPEVELPKLFARNSSVTIFDIGACEGDDSIRYAKLFPQGRIFTFEPLPENQALLLENFRQHQVRNAELVPVALSNKSGTAEFHVSSGTPPTLFEGENWNYGNKSSSLLSPATQEPMFGWVEFKKTIAIECQSLEEFCRERGVDRIDFIHMDVQGAELLVLQGSASMLPHITSIWLEVSEKPLYQGQGLRSEVEQLMKKAGFILAFQNLREIEGDQFYVNRRHGRVWIYLANRQARNIGRKLRQKLGGLKRRLLSGMNRKSQP